MMIPALLSVAVPLLFLPGTPAPFLAQTPFNVTVANSVTNTPSKTYKTYTAFKGILLSGLKRLRDSNQNFMFTYTNDFDKGPILESVNGLYGCSAQHTFWKLKAVRNGTVIPDVGIGCFIPCAYDEVFLEFSKDDPAAQQTPTTTPETTTHPTQTPTTTPETTTHPTQTPTTTPETTTRPSQTTTTTP
ncbi:hepatitis A virus cellular receptor 1-like [Cheilinus undulatus]|uniref:hepatitis A virus cellular receptor 1-like n=1 Tax=Cheilinus undulatus TaxID=241271 RepID=UPI001BD5DE4E|nr:hepatitis A virus cellular receptor 1-like [Cheilinus undulatus]XP_041668122.1 hepatitis A virus cellular receptor 1-like [Cheilinus undulatus]XP_041668132.1 hepatitis A virus cellular receptor 1-like [Cheilinus undulatus]